MASLNDIRSTFINSFEKNGHTHVESSPLVPRNDPSLMFTNAGMVQFKNTFIGQESRDYSRAVTSQKCVRAGGKHNDLDNVGYTARHHTFFEMLGNFSFGDYFKEDAIPYAWNLLTKEFGLPKEKLLVTVYHTDDEAANIWKKVAGLTDEKIIRIPTDDNFWSMGATGPCGPCTEIFYDHGEDIFGGPPGSADEDGDRFIEIWNLVFMQHEKFEDGSQTDLPKPSIDTGMGLERVGAILQGKHDNYDTDIFRALIEASAQATGVDPDGSQNVSHRVIADHLRSASFLIADGVMPSNEGRGYVLRRIMRRAMRHAHMLGAQDPVMHKLVKALVGKMGGFFPELGRAQSTIEETLLLEETRFKTTLDRGLKLLDDELGKIATGVPLAGDVAFKLYDTYGFPLDLTQDALREKNIAVDVDGFNASMAEQKAKARAAWTGSGEAADAPIWFEFADKHGSTEFLGYNDETSEAHVLALVVDGKAVKKLAKGDKGALVVNQTPFYGESGGQVGDHGLVTWDDGKGVITDTKKINGVFVHTVEVQMGELVAALGVKLDVDRTRRSAIQANHSATHLLHEALRHHLGDHVAQRGSLNADDRLRFDFSHNKSMTSEELNAVAREVNHYIRQNTEVTTRIMTPDDARALGAQALFGEKYGDEVRVVSMGRDEKSGKGQDKSTYSIELCGGTHVKRTGDIGAFVLLSDSASSAGVRRIEAITGEAAVNHMIAQSEMLSSLASSLKAKPEDIANRVHSLQDERKAQAGEISDLKRQLATGGGASDDAVEEINGVKFMAKRVDGLSGKELPALMDALKAQIGTGVIAIFAVEDGRVACAIGTAGGAMPSAKDLITIAIPEIGGKGGGGRPDMAQGGGNNADGIEAAIAALRVKISG